LQKKLATATAANHEAVGPEVVLLQRQLEDLLTEAGKQNARAGRPREILRKLMKEDERRVNRTQVFEAVKNCVAMFSFFFNLFNFSLLFLFRRVTYAHFTSHGLYKTG